MCRAAWLGGVVWLFAGMVLAAQLRLAAEAPQTNIRVDKDVVLVPVTVCDPSDRVMIGLDKQHFRIFDEKAEQTITQFWMDDAPVAVGLVFDTSASMDKKLRRSRMAATEFFKAS